MWSACVFQEEEDSKPKAPKRKRKGSSAVGSDSDWRTNHTPAANQPLWPLEEAPPPPTDTHWPPWEGRGTEMPCGDWLSHETDHWPAGRRSPHGSHDALGRGDHELTDFNTGKMMMMMSAVVCEYFVPFFSFFWTLIVEDPDFLLFLAAPSCLSHCSKISWSVGNIMVSFRSHVCWWAGTVAAHQRLKSQKPTEQTKKTIKLLKQLISFCFFHSVKSDVCWLINPVDQEKIDWLQ